MTTRIRRFNESNDNNFKHGRIGREELEDFFLEFIDTGDLKWYIDYIDHLERYETHKDPTINTYFEINNKFRKMKDTDTVNRYCQLLKSISDVCSRWKLDFSIESGAYPPPGGPQNHITQLVIKQPVPKVILDNFPTINNSDIRITFDGRKLRFSKWLKHDKDLNFYMSCKVSTFMSGSGRDGRWLKADDVWYNKNEEQILKQIEKEFIIPCKYVNKVEDRYQFKLFV